jgi:hypothetical protein
MGDRQGVRALLGLALPLTVVLGLGHLGTRRITDSQQRSQVSQEHMCDIGNTHLGELSLGIGENRAVSSSRTQLCLPQKLRPFVRKELCILQP